MKKEMASGIKICGISGSFRRGSFNTALLRACREFLPEGVVLEEVPIADLPFYNADVEAEGFPPTVARMRRSLASADAVILAVPEYTHSIPGVLQNALDWGSRPPDMPLARKPLAIIGASTGPVGTARAQIHLREMASALNMVVVYKPEVLVSFADRKFDAQGNFLDETGKKFLGELIGNLLESAVHSRP
jgi:chromate reductase, NAD(P)H dehydrogenase (quinone)